MLAVLRPEVPEREPCMIKLVTKGRLNDCVRDSVPGNLLQALVCDPDAMAEVVNYRSP
jgi:hypothetical protein